MNHHGTLCDCPICVGKPSDGDPDDDGDITDYGRTDATDNV